MLDRLRKGASVRHRIILVLASFTLLAACGGSDNRAETARTVEIDMLDIALSPDTINVEQGETVRFVFTNKGKVPHDAFIGDRAAQMEHGTLMTQSGGHDHGGGHGNSTNSAVTVEPGKSAQLTYTFDKVGTVEVGCHQPGHYDGGMRTRVTVS